MNRHSQAPMPAALRHMMRAGQHPARAHACPHCGAAAHKPCALRSASKRRLPQIHPQRMATWAQTTACCPTCQVTPTVPCHADGRALPGGSVHDERYTEAERTAA